MNLSMGEWVIVFVKQGHKAKSKGAWERGEFMNAPFGFNHKGRYIVL